MSNRQSRKTQAEETLAIIDSGGYQLGTGDRVDISRSIEEMKRGTRVFQQSDIDQLPDSLQAAAASAPTVTVANETTFAAAQRFTRNLGLPCGCLNFASAKNPGGGFLGGSSAQEEALARSSTLYASLIEADGAYYQQNRRIGTAIYTDATILSPSVTVFRDDYGSLLETPFDVSIITAPAPNRGAVERNEPERLSDIPAVFHRRIRNVLALFANQGTQTLVLGAWGCGVFRNDPTKVADWFHEALFADGFGKIFQQIHFAVLDHDDGPCIKAFQNTFT